MNLPTRVLICEEPSEILQHVLPVFFQEVHARNTGEDNSVPLNLSHLGSKGALPQTANEESKRVGLEIFTVLRCHAPALIRICFLQIVTNDTYSQKKLWQGTK